MRLRTIAILAVLVLAPCAARAQIGPFADPFGATLRLGEPDAGAARLTVAFHVPAKHYLYADSVAVEASGGTSLRVVERPQPKRKHDPFSDSERDVYLESFQIVYEAAIGSANSLALTIAYQGCSDQLCYMPTQHNAEARIGKSLTVGTAPTGANASPNTSIPPLAPLSEDPDSEIAPGFAVAASTSGYQKSEDFIRFLDEAQTGATAETGLLDMGIWLMVLTVLAGGLLLNLTPCILPMIPINLAIIGAGAQASSRTRGFALGGVYGAAIALTYGTLGLVVVLTGATFGALNASPWFNFAIAVVFVVLALAMFDVIHIDFTRFRKGGPTDASRRGRFALAFGMGVVAALLAGACVAPVVISVLLASAGLYADGNAAGLLLPFLLGAGMALPWPFAGASLSFLPKPGRWMNWVKVAFGLFILIFAAYYGKLGYGLLAPRANDEEAARIAAIQKEHAEEGGWLTSLPEALDRAQHTGKPILIDFWATWCKNCLHMEQTTFKAPAVLDALGAFVLLKYQAENPREPETERVLKRFGVLGLPTYVVLKPTDTSTPRPLSERNQPQ